MKTIVIKNGDIFNSTAQVIVNPVNTVGTMGKGLALQFKEKYPQMFERYKEYCKSGKLVVGKLWFYKPPTGEPWVLNFPTKKHWKSKSKYEYIRMGLKKIKDNYQELDLISIAFPKIGCGLGGLDWGSVKSDILTILKDTNLTIELYE